MPPSRHHVPRLLALAAAAVLWTAPFLRAQDDGDQAVQIEKLRQQIEKTLAEEEEALGRLSAQTLDLDGQVKAVEELKMLKADLDMLRQQRTGVEKGNEKALGRLDRVAADIISSAVQVQMATTDAEVEKVMAEARDKVSRVRREFALGMKRAQASAQKELDAVMRTLDELRRQYARLFAGNEKIAAQYDALALEIKELGRRLLRSGGFSDEKEIVRICNAIREKIRILTLNVKLLARQERDAAGPAAGRTAAADDGYVNDIFTTASLEELRFIHGLQQLKTQVAFLYFNTQTYNFTMPAAAILRAMVAVAVLLLTAATFGLIMARRDVPQ